MGYVENSHVYHTYIGVDIGQMQDPTAIVIADPERREESIHYVIRTLRRLPLGTKYQDVIKQIKQVYDGIPQPEGYVEVKKSYEVIRRKPKLERRIWIDATGVGHPVVDLLRSELEDAHIHAVFFTGGEARERINVSARNIVLPKMFLVSRLQVLFSTGRMHLPSRSPESMAMKEELMNYQIKVTESANVTAEAKVGKHDDLVVAVGLATLLDDTTILRIGTW